MRLTTIIALVSLLAAGAAYAEPSVTIWRVRPVGPSTKQLPPGPAVTWSGAPPAKVKTIDVRAQSLLDPTPIFPHSQVPKVEKRQDRLEREPEPGFTDLKPKYFPAPTYSAPR